MSVRIATSMMPDRALSEDVEHDLQLRFFKLDFARSWSAKSVSDLNETSFKIFEYQARMRILAMHIPDNCRDE
jgi:hypothetical protein